MDFIKEQKKHCEKISKTMKNRKLTISHKRKISKARKGMKFSKNTRIKMSKAKRGKRSGNYKDGSTSKKHYCKCGKEIWYHTSLYGQKQCQSCATTGKNNPFYGKHHTEVTKNKLRKKLRGKNSVHYIHGKGKKPYPINFTSSLKKEIRRRDNFECQNCNMTEEEHIIIYGRALEVHHINFNKNDNCKENLKTLCKPCNLSLNKDRNKNEKKQKKNRAKAKRR